MVTDRNNSYMENEGILGGTGNLYEEDISQRPSEASYIIDLGHKYYWCRS